MSNQTKLRRLCSLTLVALPVDCVSVTRSGLLALTLDEARRISRPRPATLVTPRGTICTPPPIPKSLPTRRARDTPRATANSQTERRGTGCEKISALSQ